MGLQACGWVQAHISHTQELERKCCVIINLIILRPRSGQVGPGYFLEIILKNSCMLVSVVQLADRYLVASHRQLHVRRSIVLTQQISSPSWTVERPHRVGAGAVMTGCFMTVCGWWGAQEP